MKAEDPGPKMIATGSVEPFLTLCGQEVCPRARRNNVAQKRLDKGQMDLDGIFWYHPVVDG